jgi:hypothetical protein
MVIVKKYDAIQNHSPSFLHTRVCSVGRPTEVIINTLHG